MLGSGEAAAGLQAVDAPPGPQCVVRPWGRGQGSGRSRWTGTWGVSGFSASLRYFFGAGSSCACSCVAVSSAGSVFGVAAGCAGLCLLGDSSWFLLQASPAGLVQPHVAQHGLWQTCVGETGPLCEQRLPHICHEAWRGRRGSIGRFKLNIRYKW